MANYFIRVNLKDGSNLDKKKTTSDARFGNKLLKSFQGTSEALDIVKVQIVTQHKTLRVWLGGNWNFTKPDIKQTFKTEKDFKAWVKSGNVPEMELNAVGGQRQIKNDGEDLSKVPVGGYSENGWQKLRKTEPFEDELGIGWGSPDREPIQDLGFQPDFNQIVEENPVIQQLERENAFDGMTVEKAQAILSKSKLFKKLLAKYEEAEDEDDEGMRQGLVDELVSLIRKLIPDVDYESAQFNDNGIYDETDWFMGDFYFG